MGVPGIPGPAGTAVTVSSHCVASGFVTAVVVAATVAVVAMDGFPTAGAAVDRKTPGFGDGALNAKNTEEHTLKFADMQATDRKELELSCKLGARRQLL